MYPPKIRIAVPSGVGDCYWSLGKMADFRRQHAIQHVTLCVQKSPFPRALDWPKLVPGLVDAAEEFRFIQDRNMMTSGFTRAIAGVHCGFWPNSMIDRGVHLSQWMPNYKLDLDFEVKTEHTLSASDIVVYASSVDVNKAWFPNGGPAFWSQVLELLSTETGVMPTLIGAAWDANFHAAITGPHHSLVGKTSLPQIADVLKNARLVVGIISGMTILANHFRTPCVAIAPPKMLDGFHTAWIKEGTPYKVLKAPAIQSPQALVETALALRR